MLRGQNLATSAARGWEFNHQNDHPPPQPPPPPPQPPPPPPPPPPQPPPPPPPPPSPCPPPLPYQPPPPPPPLPPLPRTKKMITIIIINIKVSIMPPRNVNLITLSLQFFSLNFTGRNDTTHKD
ncbi:MAG TPA: hypothetical protein ENK04_07535 [Gammaproteobacteria bacterium]|nr:hypothetical protein [Gammaproteobacteria bacterium]